MTQPVITSVSKKLTEKFKDGKPYFIFSYRENGHRKQAGSSSFDKAESKRKAMAQNQIIGQSSHFSVVSKLSPSQISDSEAAFSLLESNGFLDTNDADSGKALLKAVQWFIQNYREETSPITIREAYDKFIQYKESNISPSTLRQYGASLGKWVDQIGHRKLSSLSSAECHTWVYSFKSAIRKKTSWGYLQTFLNYSMGKNNVHGKWLSESPLNFQKPKSKEGDIHALSFGELKDLLKSQPKSLGYIIFAVYSLMRVSEIENFHRQGEVWENPLIQWEESKIHLPASIVGKNGNKRIIPIGKTFMVWLKYLKENKISISPHQFRIPSPDKRNILRHSAITFHNLYHGDTYQSSTIAGNSEGQIRKHYRNPNISKKDAKAIYESFSPSSI
jgi:integrase